MNNKFLIAFSLILQFTSVSFAQVQQNDSIIVKALQDEMNRNFNQLQEDGYEKPFFIAYTMADTEMKYAVATLGGIVSSDNMRNRNWFTRLMVGDYTINDENFTNSFSHLTYPSNYEPLPIKSDYWGIRRAFWIATNNVYKSAARKYNQKIKTLKEFEIEYPIADFSVEKPITYYDSSQYTLAEMSYLKERSRNLSALFLPYENIIQSAVFISDFGARSYFVNIEGTSIVQPHQFSSIGVSINCLGKDNIPISGQIQYTGRSLSELPTNDEIANDIDVWVNELKTALDVDPLKDQYQGPVLIEGVAVAEFFMRNILHTNSGGVIDERPVLNNENKNTVNKYIEKIEEAQTPDENGNIAKDYITVLALSKLEQFQNQPLYGHFKVDAEGVVPPDTLVLIKNGKVRNKFNSRTPSPTQEKSNGHNRLIVDNGNLNHRLLPGVIQIKVGKTMSMDQLKETLLTYVDKEELSFGIHVKSLPLKADKRPLKFYKVNRSTGEESQVLIASLNSRQRNNKMLKEVLAATDDYKVYNILIDGGSGFNTSGMATDGAMVSVIVPSAILVENYELNSFTPNETPFESVIPMPAK